MQAHRAAAEERAVVRDQQAIDAEVAKQLAEKLSRHEEAIANDTADGFGDELHRPIPQLSPRGLNVGTATSAGATGVRAGAR